MYILCQNKAAYTIVAIIKGVHFRISTQTIDDTNVGNYKRYMLCTVQCYNYTSLYIYSLTKPDSPVFHVRVWLREYSI